LQHVNHINGTIPTKFGNLDQVCFLEVGENELIGTIPSETGRLQLLKPLVLSNNELCGTVPTSLLDLAALRKYIYFHLAATYLIIFISPYVSAFYRNFVAKQE
jgi:hypothetical protein